VAADQRRGRDGQRPLRAVHGGRLERRVLLQDRTLQVAKGGRRLEAQLVRQGAARIAARFEGLLLAAAPVERERTLLEDALAVGMLRDERVELGDERLVPAAGELGIVAELDCDET